MDRILIQLDTDSHPSSFDAITAYDGGVDRLLSYANITRPQVSALVHGAIFTRSPAKLKNTAIFVGGSSVETGQEVFDQVKSSFFGPMRVSAMMDSNGCNTTAAAAVKLASEHLNLSQSKGVVLGATGPVGSRIAKILYKQGCTTKIVSRTQKRAEVLRHRIGGSDASRIIPCEFAEGQDLTKLLGDVDFVIAAGAAGVEFCSLDDLLKIPNLKLAIDLNAVPPLGIQGIESGDKNRVVDHLICYGAIGVGGFKMKLHRALIEKLFESNDCIYDTEEIFDFANTLG